MQDSPLKAMLVLSTLGIIFRSWRNGKLVKWLRAKKRLKTCRVVCIKVMPQMEDNQPLTEGYMAAPISVKS
jgi:hypothetical protein